MMSKPCEKLLVLAHRDTLYFDLVTGAFGFQANCYSQFEEARLARSEIFELLPGAMNAPPMFLQSNRE